MQFHAHDFGLDHFASWPFNFDFKKLNIPPPHLICTRIAR